MNWISLVKTSLLLHYKIMAALSFNVVVCNSEGVGKCNTELMQLKGSNIDHSAEML